MRIKNKELRARRHRKEQTIKEAARQLRAQYGDGKTGVKPAAAPKKAAPAAKKAPAKKPAAKKTEE
jgi:hypothetical protein